MKFKITTNFDDLNTIQPLSINEKVVFFLEKGFKPDDLGYLCKNNKYIKLNENSISLIDKNKVWDQGIAKDISILHIAD